MRSGKLQVPRAEQTYVNAPRFTGFHVSNVVISFIITWFLTTVIFTILSMQFLWEYLWDNKWIIAFILLNTLANLILLIALKKIVAQRNYIKYSIGFAFIEFF
jgi:hypothetical protein